MAYVLVLRSLVMIIPKIASSIPPLLPSLLFIFDRGLYSLSNFKSAESRRTSESIKSPSSPSSPRLGHTSHLITPSTLVGATSIPEGTDSSSIHDSDSGRPQPSPMMSPLSSRPTSPGHDDIITKSLRLVTKYQEQIFEKLSASGLETDAVTQETLRSSFRGYYSLLYGMFPCTLVAHIKTLYEKKVLSEASQLILQDLFRTHSFHPNLLFSTPKAEMDPARWSQAEPQDVVGEYLKLSLFGEGQLAARSQPPSRHSIGEVDIPHAPGASIAASFATQTALRSLSFGSSSEPSPYHSRDQSPLPGLDSPTHETEQGSDHLSRSTSARDLASLIEGSSYLSPLEVPESDQQRKSSLPQTQGSQSSGMSAASVMSTALRKLTQPSGVRRSHSDQSLALHQGPPTEPKSRPETRRNSDPTNAPVDKEEETRSDKPDETSSISTGASIKGSQTPTESTASVPLLSQESLSIEALLSIHSSLKRLFAKGQTASDPWVCHTIFFATE